MNNENAKNIFGMNLNVDPEFITDLIKKSVMSVVANALTNSDKENISQGIVNSALSVMVRKDGGAVADDYDIRNGRAIPLVEYYVSNALKESMRECLKEVIESKRDEFKKLLTKALSSKHNQESLVCAFMNSILENTTSCYRTDIEVKFNKVGG